MRQRGKHTLYLTHVRVTYNELHHFSIGTSIVDVLVPETGLHEKPEEAVVHGGWGWPRVQSGAQSLNLWIRQQCGSGHSFSPTPRSCPRTVRWIDGRTLLRAFGICDPSPCLNPLAFSRMPFSSSFSSSCSPLFRRHFSRLHGKRTTRCQRDRSEDLQTTAGNRVRGRIRRSTRASDEIDLPSRPCMPFPRGDRRPAPGLGLKRRFSR